METFPGKFPCQFFAGMAQLILHMFRPISILFTLYVQIILELPISTFDLNEKGRWIYSYVLPNEFLKYSALTDYAYYLLNTNEGIFYIVHEGKSCNYGEISKDLFYIDLKRYGFGEVLQDQYLP